MGAGYLVTKQIHEWSLTLTSPVIEKAVTGFLADGLTKGAEVPDTPASSAGMMWTSWLPCPVSLSLLNDVTHRTPTSAMGPTYHGPDAILLFHFFL